VLCGEGWYKLQHCVGSIPSESSRKLSGRSPLLTGYVVTVQASQVPEALQSLFNRVISVGELATKLNELSVSQMTIDSRVRVVTASIDPRRVSWLAW